MGAGGAILQPGDVFAEDFRIVRTTDRRGAEASYVALQLSTGKQRVLTVMLPELVADEGRRARFEQAARIGSRIKSEHVIDVVGAGIDSPTGTPWLASELLPGEDLASLVKREGALPGPTALEILEQLCDAVGAAHAAGIVHRDLKPENVFLAESAGANTKVLVKVRAFGIAGLVAESKPEQAPLTGVIGPEADVCSIGLIAFHLLTGESFGTKAESSAPPGFDAWLARSTDRDPGARFHDVRAQIQALRPLLGAATSAPARPHDTAAPPPAKPPAEAPAASPTATPAGEKTRTLFISAVAIAALVMLPSAFLVRWKPTVATPASIEDRAVGSVAVPPSQTTPVASLSDSDASQSAPQTDASADASSDDAATANAATLPGVAHGEMGRSLNIAECTAGPKLTEDEVRTIVNRNSDGLKQTCWDKSPIPSLSVSETVHVVICGTGAVQSVSASRNDTVGRCIENAVKGWRFPAGGTLDIPFHFTREFVPSGPTGPGPFDRGAAYGALGSVDLQSCKKGDSGPGHLKITFAPSGHVTNAVVDAPPFAGTAVGNCVSAKLRGAHIPPFLGPPVTLGKSFTIN